MSVWQILASTESDWTLSGQAEMLPSRAAGPRSTGSALASRASARGRGTVIELQIEALAISQEFGTPPHTGRILRSGIF